MNKSFRVLWNRFRGSYVVTSEVQMSHGKSGKAGKTVLAAAVVGAMAFVGATSAQATPEDGSLTINYDYVTSEDVGTTKFLNGNGLVVNVETTASAQQMIEDLAQSGGSISGILGAIGSSSETQTILTGLAGGTNYYDGKAPEGQELGGLSAAVNLLHSLGGMLGQQQVAEYAGKLEQQLTPWTANSDESVSVQGGTTINIGGSGSEPVLLATVGADRVLNTGLDLSVGISIAGHDGEPSDFSAQNKTIDLTRVGDVIVKADSGNLFLLTGGSSAINVSGLTLSATASKGLVSADVDATAAAESTSVTIDGNVGITLDGSTNAAGVLAAGSALALGGTSNSTVTGNVILNVDSEHDAKHKLSGLTVGALGGGLAASTLNGTANTTVKGTTSINVTNGVVVGAFGGGAALSAELQGAVWNTITGLESTLEEKLGDGSSVDISVADVGGEVTEDNSALLVNGGTATATSGNVNLNVSGDSVTVALAGGGLGIASAGGNGGESHANVVTTDVVLTIDGPALSQEQKMNLQETAGTLISAIRPVFSNISAENLLGVVDDVTTAVNTAQSELKGAHVGTIGGSIVVARMPSGVKGTVATADAKTGNVTINLNGGYNVATLGGGMAISSGYKAAEGTYAKSEVDSTTINISGGDNVLVMAGGAAYATGTMVDNVAPTSTSTSNVASASVKVTGGSVDGIFGGGLAIDDTAAAVTNAIADTTNVKIEVSGGTVYAADPSPLANIAEGDSEGKPSNGTYVDDTADLLAKKTAAAAIVGGGIATGAGAKVTSTDVTINLFGGSIGDADEKGNIYAGGAATLGGKTSVTTAEINVAGATVNGDIYGGGLVGSPRNNAFANATQYAQAESTVEDVTIRLLEGSVQNVYAGTGLTYADSDGVTNTVEKATVVIGGTDVFDGEKLSGEGTTESSTLIVQTGEDYALRDDQTVIGFDTIEAHNKFTNVTYDFASKTSTTVAGGPVEFVSLANTDGKTLAVGTTDAAGVVAVNPLSTSVTGLSLKVVNGQLALNSDMESALEAIASSPAQAQASVYLTGAVDLNNNVLLVGDVEAQDAGLAVGANGLIVANAAGGTTVNGSTAFAEGSKVHLVNVADAAENAAVRMTLQTETAPNATVDNVLYAANKTETGYTIAKRDGSSLGDVGLDDFDDAGFLYDLNGHKGNRAADFVRSFLDEQTAGVDNSNRSQQLNAAVNLATAAGVQTAAIDGTMMGIEAANKRVSLINEFHDGGVLFAELMGKHFEIGGGSSFGEIEADMGGLVVGGEYTMNDWTFGALANLGSGSIDGKGDNSGVENDVDYYGFQAYAAKRFGQFNLIGQLGYLMSDNDVEHNTVARNTANVDADVFTIGAKGEFRYDITQNSRLVPYVGLNYLRVSTDGYTTSQGVHVDDIDQNLWTMPIGVKFAGDVASANGWKWTPSVDVAFIPAFGDDDVEATSYAGSVAHTTMDVWSSSVGRLKFGVRGAKDNFGFGIEAGAATGSDDLTEYFGQVRVDYRF